MKDKYKPAVAGILIVTFALLGTVLMMHFEEEQSAKARAVKQGEIQAEQLQTLCGGENAVVEPAYQCFNKKGKKVKLILERDIK